MASIPSERSIGTCRVRFSERAGVLIVEPLDAVLASDLPALARGIAHEREGTRAQRVLLDLRPRVVGQAFDRDFRDALTQWAIRQETPLMLVVEDEMHIAEINMASLGEGGLTRAFATTAEAFRHAIRSADSSSASSTRRSQLFPRRRPSERVSAARRTSELPPREAPFAATLPSTPAVHAGSDAPRSARESGVEFSREANAQWRLTPPSRTAEEAAVPRSSGVLPSRDHGDEPPDTGGLERDGSS